MGGDIIVTLLYCLPIFFKGNLNKKHVLTPPKSQPVGQFLKQNCGGLRFLLEYFSYW